jgi:hypothetical protein
MTAIKLPDALVDALKAHNMRDIEAMEAFATRAIWKQLQEEDEEDSTTPEETEEAFQARVTAMRERYDQYKRGEFITAKDYFAEKKVAYEARKQREFKSLNDAG